MSSKRIVLLSFSLAIVAACGDVEFPANPPGSTVYQGQSRPPGSSGPCTDEYPLRVGGNVKPPVRLNPEHRPANTRPTATVTIVDLVIDSHGSVIDARTLKAPSPEVAARAEQIVKTWRFLPGTCNGKPVSVVVSMIVPVEWGA